MDLNLSLIPQPISSVQHIHHTEMHKAGKDTGPTCLQGIPNFFNLLLLVCNKVGTPSMAWATLSACASTPLMDFTKS